MSLILDALNRAERERNKGPAVPNLHTVHEPLPAPATPPKNNLVTIVAIVFCGLFLLGGIFYLMTKQPAVIPPTASSTGSSELPVASSEVLLVSPEPPLASEVPALAAPASSEGKVEDKKTETVQQERVLASAESSSTADLAALYASAREQEAIPERVVDELYQAPVAQPVAQAEETIDAINAPTATASRIPVSTMPAVKDYASLVELPDIGDLPWSFRQQIPTINYVRHNYHNAEATNGRDSVVINGRAHHAGDTLAADLVLEEIIVDGVILRFKQTRFKLRALNSWINM